MPSPRSYATAEAFRGGLKESYALELRLKEARSTVDIDLTMPRVASSADVNQNEVIRPMLQTAADARLGDWFEFVVGPRPA